MRLKEQWTVSQPFRACQRTSPHTTWRLKNWREAKAGRDPVAPVKSAQSHRPPARERSTWFLGREKVGRWEGEVGSARGTSLPRFSEYWYGEARLAQRCSSTALRLGVACETTIPTLIYSRNHFRNVLPEIGSAEWLRTAPCSSSKRTRNLALEWPSTRATCFDV